MRFFELACAYSVYGAAVRFTVEQGGVLGKAAARSFVMRLYNVLVGKLNFLQFKLTGDAATQDLLAGMKRKLE